MQINIAGRQQPAATGRHSQRTGLRPQIDRAIGRVNRRARNVTDESPVPVIVPFTEIAPPDGERKVTGSVKVIALTVIPPVPDG